MPQVEGTALIKFTFSAYSSKFAMNTFKAALVAVEAKGIKCELLVEPEFYTVLEKEEINAKAAELFGEVQMDIISSCSPSVRDNHGDTGIHPDRNSGSTPDTEQDLPAEPES